MKKAEYKAFAEEAKAAMPAQFDAESGSATPPFDIHDFDTRLAVALGIETPDAYAQRKAEEEGPGHPVKQPDGYSLGRKLVAMLGDKDGSTWTWSAIDNFDHGVAAVWREGDEANKVEVTTNVPEMALRAAALDALAAQ